jgi:hypothetical protein
MNNHQASALKTPGWQMILYHRTTAKNAQQILTRGFQNATGTYPTDRLWTGVWVSDRPLTGGEGGADGDTLLRITIKLNETELADFEWVEEGKGYREWLIDAALLNAKVRVAIVPLWSTPPW